MSWVVCPIYKTLWPWSFIWLSVCITLYAQNSLSGKRIGATKDQMNRAAVAQLVEILTQTDAHPTSTNFPLPPTEVDQPVRSIAEYMLASEKMMWKKEYEYVTGFAFSRSSCSSALSNGSKGFPVPTQKTNHSLPSLYGWSFKPTVG